jgi:ribosomal protein L36
MQADTQEKVAYLIPAVNMPRLQSEINRLNKRAKKLGCQPLELKIVKTISVKRADPVLKIEYESTSYECEIIGESPKLNGWTLIASIEPIKNQTTNTVENVVREVPGVICPAEYRTTNMECQHCNTIRRRSAIFVLRNEKNEHKQVGRNCIADFLGNVSPDHLLNKAECLWGAAGLMSDAREENWGSGRGERIVEIMHFVTIVSVLCRRLGWMPRSKAEVGKVPTASLAWDICAYPTSEKIQKFVREHNIEAEERDAALAEDAVRWAAAIEPLTAPSTYLYDLGVCCRQDLVSYKTTGYVASVISAFQRHLSDELAKNAPQNEKSPRPAKQHIGVEKERIVLNDLTITHATSYSGNYGAKTFIRFTDSNQNVLIWRATGNPEWAVIGDKVSIKATIKKHETFNGQPNTILSRVDLIESNNKKAHESDLPCMAG